MVTAVEVADDMDGSDSGYDETFCSTESVRSSVYAYETQHGRTYHAFHAGKYMLPNDQGEQERMNLHYHALRETFSDKLFFAPIEMPTGILDVGTGTGIWAMDVADEHPQADVVGCDLSPIQPNFVPPNLQFEVLDADETWNYAAHRFNLVHTRFMNGFSLKSWPHFYVEAMKYLKPGGWVENQEFDLKLCSDDNSIPANSKMKEWGELWNRGAEIAGVSGRCDPQLMAEQMRDAGFVNVSVMEFKMPIGAWPKDKRLHDAGIYGLRALLDGLYGLSVKLFTTCLGWTPEELEVFLESVRVDLRKKAIHSYWPTVSKMRSNTEFTTADLVLQYVVLGQKPPLS